MAGGSAAAFDLEMAPFDLGGLVRDTADGLARRARDKGLDLGVVVSDSLPTTVVGDATRVRQILLSLLGNAIEHTESGEVMVSLTAEPVHGGRVVIRCEVSDTGIGIPDDERSRLFERRAPAGGSAAPGTDHGLATAYRVVALMDGRLRCSSRVGHGSTFSLTLALDLPGDVEESRSPIRGASARILVVDGDDVNRRFATVLLEQADYTTDVAASGREALEALRGSLYDAVLIDLELPVSDGYATTSAIRRGEAGAPDMPVIALSESAVAEDRRRAYAAGVDAYLAKPLRRGELEEVLGLLISGCETRRAPDRAPGTSARRP